jgi:hypothetical protein
MKQLVFLFLASVPTALGEYYRCAANDKKGWKDKDIEWEQNYDSSNKRTNYTVKKNTDSAEAGCRGNVEDGEVTDLLPIEGMTLNIENNPDNNTDRSITNLSMTWDAVNFHTFLIRHECNQKPYIKVNAAGNSGACYTNLIDGSGTVKSLECTKGGSAGSKFYVSGDKCNSLKFTVTIGGKKDCGTYSGSDDTGRSRELEFTATNWCGPEYGNLTVDTANKTIVVSLGGVAATQINTALGNKTTSKWTNKSIADVYDYTVSVADVKFRLLEGSAPAKDVVTETTYKFEYNYTSTLSEAAGGTATTASDVADCINGTQQANVHDCATTSATPWSAGALDAGTHSHTSGDSHTTMTFTYTPNCTTLFSQKKDCCLSAMFELRVKEEGKCQGTARRQLSSPLASGRSLQMSGADFTQTSRAFTMRVLRQSEVDDAGVDVTVAVEDEDTGVAGWVPPVAVAALLICAALVYTLTRSPKMLQRALGPATKVLPTE